MLLKSYRKEIIRPECRPEAESLHCIAHLDQDIGEVLPISMPPGRVPVHQGPAFGLVQDPRQADRGPSPKNLRQCAER